MRAGISIAQARFLLQRLSDSRFCSFHHNQTRHCKDAVDNASPNERGLKRGFCVFRGKGCLQISSILRPISRPHPNTLEEIESYSEFVDSIHSHSGGALGAADVFRQQACGTCRYVLGKGSTGTRPMVDNAVLKCATDRCLVDCVLFALEMETTGEQESVYIRGNEDVMTEARKLKEVVVAPFAGTPNARFLPVSEVRKLRTVLHEKSIEGSRHVCGKTVESRIGPVLAARNVHSYSLSRKFRCYAMQNSLSDSLNSIMFLSTGDEVLLSPRERRRMMATVCQRFLEYEEKYRLGKWLLSEEIMAVPSKLWASMIIEMASKKQLASWKVASAAKNIAITKLFPVCNDKALVPAGDIDNFASLSLQSDSGKGCLPRADFVLSIRALKVVEQIAVSRSRLCVGPLTETLSVAGIMECTPSWRSVLHSLGIVTSLGRSESFRKRLIAEREKATRGAFESVRVDDRIVTVQIDNFDILPLHSLKAAGKALPMISGTATQRILRSRKRRRIEKASCEEHIPCAQSTAPQCNWLRVNDTFISREVFVASFNTEKDRCILNDFFDIVFGIVYQNRARLMDISEEKQKFTRGRTELLYKHQGLNFRSLLLSCFKQHGGVESDDPTLYDQEVLFVDVSRMSAADILTIHEKIALIMRLLTPGNPGCPRYIVVSGDQPTYRMLVKIWRNSYL